MCGDSPERASDANTVDSANTNDDLAMSRILQQSLLSLPVTCTITILPEIPVDPSTNNNHGDSSYNQDQGPLSLTRSGHYNNDSIRMERQGLRPCGMDNVFLLRDLFHAADPASYLLSMTSCETTLTHLDTPNGVLLEIDPVTVSVHAVPSTFLFAFENVATKAQGDNTILVNPRRALAELNVTFDLSVALDRLEGIVKDSVALRDVMMEKEETPLHENPLHQNSPVHFEKTKENCQTTNEHSYEGHHPTQHQDQLLHVLHELAENESRHLDWMLGGLGFVFILLMVHYARTISPLMRSKQSLKKRNKATSCADQSQSRVSDGVETEVKGTFHLACNKSRRNMLSYSWLLFLM
jgi:hypothetical protein